MTKQEAIAELTDGHAMFRVQYAREICKALGLTLDDKIIKRWKNQADANPNSDPRGLWLNDPDKPGEGVYSLTLAWNIAERLKADTKPASQMMGRGFQASALAKAIATKIGK